MTRSTNMEHVEVLRHMKETIKAIAPSEVAALDAAIAALSAPQPPAEAQPVAWQFQDREGNWHGFINEKHRLNTIEDGSWPIRALYVHPPPSAPVGVPVDVVREYLDARACYDAATRPPNSHARAPVLKHDDPDALRLREARVALDNAIALAQQPAAPRWAAASAEPAVWVTADTLNSPHPTCISSLAYMSQLDRERGREYVPLYAAPQQPASCVGCEGKPAPENAPCAVCGRQPAAHPAITHCDNCGCDWLDNGLNPIGCPYCKQNAWRAAYVVERATRYREGGMKIEQARIHAETDATLVEKIARQQQGGES